MHQKDRTDWLAYILVLLIFAALVAALTGIASGNKLPFLGNL